MKLYMFAMFVSLLVCGCSTSTQKPNVVGRVPMANALLPLIGEWNAEDGLALLVLQDGEQLVIDNPPNDMWRFEITNVSSTGSSVRFDQQHFMLDGSYNPFSDVVCKCEISPVEGDPNAISFTMFTPQLPEGATEIYPRHQ